MLLFDNGTLEGSILIGVIVPQFDYTSALTSFPGVYGTCMYVEELLSRSYIRISGRDPREVFGTPYVKHNPSYASNRGLPPHMKAYDGLEDVNKYTTSIGSALHVLNPNRPGVPLREHQVAHLTIDGKVSPRVQELYTYDEGKTWSWRNAGLRTPDQSLYGVYTPRFHTINHDPPNFYGTQVAIGYYDYLITDQIEKIIDQLHRLEDKPSQLEFLGDIPSLGNVLKPHDVKLFGDSDGYYFKGVFNVRKRGPRRISYSSVEGSRGAIRIFDIDLTIDPWYVGSIDSFNDYGRHLYDIHFSSTIRERWFEAEPNFSGEFFGWKPRMWDGQSEMIHHVSYVSAAHNILLSAPVRPMIKVPDIAIDSRSQTLRLLGRQFENDLGIFRPSAMYSYADAISHYRHLATNYIEVIVEAKELFELVPGVIDLVKTLYLGPKDDIADVGLKLGDFFSSYELMSRFGWDPILSNGQELSSKLDSIGNALRTLQSPKTLHGKFTWSGEVAQYGPVSLTTRSKVRLRGASDEFLIRTLQLDALGLLPRSSNLWDLVPWSWFVDYFTNLSSRYDVIDSVVLGLMWGLDFAVHSFTVTTPLGDTILEQNGVSPIGEDPTLHFYARELSLLVPMMFESSIDFGEQIHPPNKGIIASLLWQILRRG